MSTAFGVRSTGEWAFTRWCGPESRPGRATFDFGVDPSRVFAVAEAAAAGEVFDGDDGSTVTWAEVEAGAWSFGDFGGTFEVGSGDAATWAGM